MNFDFTPDEALFREEVRDWLRSNVPHGRPENEAEALDFDRAWQARQFSEGWAGISWPMEYGGRGLSLVQQLIWFEEYALAGGPPLGHLFVALSHAGPTLIARGDESQKAFHLPQILKGEAIWCQGFSEPGAGSDLANLQTRADIDGDHLVVNGSKIWSSRAQYAVYQELLVRTSGSGRGHAGISWVIGDMRLPGITVRPIKCIDGQPHFCEVFFDDVRIPLANVVGEIDKGWSVAMATLGFERGTATLAEQIHMSHVVEQLIDRAKSLPGWDGHRPAFEDDEIASRLATLRAEVAALRAMSYAAISRGLRAPVPGAEGTLIALYNTELMQRIYRMGIDLLGAELLSQDGHAKSWIRKYHESIKQTIAGGTAEIRRNIVGERLLGLPK